MVHLITVPDQGGMSGNNPAEIQSDQVVITGLDCRPRVWLTLHGATTQDGRQTTSQWWLALTLMVQLKTPVVVRFFGLDIPLSALPQDAVINALDLINRSSEDVANAVRTDFARRLAEKASVCITPNMVTLTLPGIGDFQGSPNASLESLLNTLAA